MPIIDVLLPARHANQGLVNTATVNASRAYLTYILSNNAAGRRQRGATTTHPITTFLTFGGSHIHPRSSIHSYSLSR